MLDSIAGRCGASFGGYRALGFGSVDTGRIGFQLRGHQGALSIRFYAGGCGYLEGGIGMSLRFKARFVSEASDRPHGPLEGQIPKLDVAGSNPVSRSNITIGSSMS